MNCLFCGSEQHKIFARVESFGFPLVYYRCSRCGIVFQSPGESKAADPDFYAETYRKIYQTSVTPTAKDLWVQEQRAAALVQFLRAHTNRHPERILDIGASTGLLLEAFQKAFDSDITGVEPGDAYRAHAEQRGIAMAASLDDLIAANVEPFDLVSMIHVLEHLPDPVSTLTIIKEKLLTEKGALLLEVPNFYAHESYELAHITCFTPRTLQSVLQQAGFQTIALHAHGLPRSSLLKLYLTVYAQPLAEGTAKPALKADTLVRMKRYFGMLYRRLIEKLFSGKAWLPLPDENES